MECFSYSAKLRSCLLWLQMYLISVNCDMAPNVLFIVSDDLRPELGSFGAPVLTPNLDQLAAQSIKFTNAHVQQAVCAPSRTSFLTSRRPDTTRLYDFDSYWRKSAGNYTTLPQHFKEHGYFAASVGKVFHKGVCSNFTDDYPLSWSVPAYWAPTEQYISNKVCGPGSDGQLHANLICPVNVTEQPMGTLPDIQITDHALEILKNLSKSQSNLSPVFHANHSSPKTDENTAQQPFFLAVGYHKPHLPLKYPQEFRDLYPLESIEIAPNRYLPPKLPRVAWDVWNYERSFDDIHALNVSFPYGPMPLKYHYLIRQSYYAAVTYMDYQVGRLLAGLEEAGFAQNTIVLFVGDHGWQLGEHQEWGKYSNYDVATRVPLLIHVPGVTDTAEGGAKFPSIDPLQKEHLKSSRKYLQRYSDNAKQPDVHYGYSADQFVELVDMFPTLADLAGLEVPPTCPENPLNEDFCTEGTSLVPLINLVIGRSQGDNKILRWKNGTFSQYPRPSDTPQKSTDLPSLANITIMGYSMKTDSYHYTEWISFNHTTFEGNWEHVHARELYVLQEDALEDNNVVDDPKYASLVKDLSKKLQGGWRYSLPVFAKDDRLIYNKN